MTPFVRLPKADGDQDGAVVAFLSGRLRLGMAVIIARFAKASEPGLYGWQGPILEYDGREDNLEVTSQPLKQRRCSPPHSEPETTQQCAAGRPAVRIRRPARGPRQGFRISPAGSG